MPDIKFTALGGQDERGKNLYVLEIDNDFFILDAGVKYPEKDILGIDTVIPKFDYIKQNKKKIKGIFLTNPSAYNMGAVPYLLKEIEAPIYCNEITELIAKIKFQKLRLKNKDHILKVVHDKDILKIGNTKVEIFRTTSSSPQSFGYVFHTELGSIVYAGDYIIDGKEQSYFSTDYTHLSQIAKNGVLALISDAEFASRKDFTVPNHKIDKYILAPFKEKKTKIIVAIFEEDIHKLSQICMAAKENNRKIAVYGRTMDAVLRSNLIHEDLVIKPEDLMSIQEYVNSDNGVLIISGTGDDLYSKLAKIATSNDSLVEFTEKDLIILTNTPVAGVEKRHAQILDELARTDARLLALSDKNIWSMRASYEDIKMLTSILNPKYFIPVKALYKDFLNAEKAAIEAGVNNQNIGIIDNGEILKLSKNHLAISEHSAEHGNVYVDGSGIGDVGSIVLNERKQLATDGVIIVGATIDSRNKELISLIDTQMRGVLYIQEDNPIFKILQREITNLILEGQALYKKEPKKYDLNEIKKDITSKIKQLIKQESGKTPIVLVIINESDGKAYVPRNNKKRYNNNNKSTKSKKDKS
ncbi:ribonuclease J [Mycoplasma mycoides subsp. capri]|uniref:ribonuclease J n=1 Tax=Mycoplasma mycoides TaxID=2102 RepID=UPI00224083D4|nr:ribonuclease J [Mycoplasma mycoides]QVJ96572.1 ribonuclease J [Mycoplasma mycoides subsp. capri]QVJ97460.1 ribonuclease J [Mycoplasma mycoides subsp. capri]QVK00453.1 ribonuclease J [Mycoplasma mycoides subsp. capri]QVK01339.1 ribonuclease J [Mycoplasma mycoides subsp. capri]